MLDITLLLLVSLSLAVGALFFWLAFTNVRAAFVTSLVLLPISRFGVIVHTGYFDITPSYVMFIIVMLAWLVKKLVVEKTLRLVNAPIYKLFGLFFLANIVSLVLSGNYHEGIVKIVQLVYLMLLCILTVDILSEGHTAVRVGKIWLLSLCFVAFISLFLLFPWPYNYPPLIEIDLQSGAPSVITLGLYDKLRTDEGITFPRLSIGFGNAGDTTACYLIIGFLLCFSFLTSTAIYRKSKQKYAFGALLTIFAIFLTFFRGAWLASLVGLGMLWFLQRRSSAWILLLLIILLMIIPFWSTFSVRASQIFTGSESSRVTRLALMKETYRLATESPIFGHGVGSLRRLPPSSIEYLSDVAAYLDPENISIHSSWFRIMAETGILGLLLFCLLIFTCIKKAYKAIVASAESEERILLKGFLSSFWALTIYNLLMDGMFDWYWILMGMLVVFSKLVFVQPGIGHKINEKGKIHLLPLVDKGQKTCRTGATL